jgi:hypothetical protein
MPVQSYGEGIYLQRLMGSFSLGIIPQPLRCKAIVNSQLFLFALGLTAAINIVRENCGRRSPGTCRRIDKNDRKDEVNQDVNHIHHGGSDVLLKPEMRNDQRRGNRGATAETDA